jgi:hypothetical protein
MSIDIYETEMNKIIAKAQITIFFSINLEIEDGRVPV